jgi:uncharacterized protein YhaN
MRFCRLHLPAYGKFTDLSLNFSRQKSSTAADLHLIYGDNEAGKSTLLRAITALLYGIPARTPDNFLHSYNQLRLAAEIESSDGKVQEFQRVKALKNALRDGAGNPLPDQALIGSLGAVDETFFRMLFGMDHASLREGGERLLAQKNNLGQSLFSGSQANTVVTEAIQRLRDEADALYTVSGRKNLSLKDAVERYKDLVRQLRDAQVDPEQWTKARDNAREASQAREALDQQLSANQLSREWLVRCRDSAPLIHQLQSLKSELKGLPEFPLLPEDFANQVHQLCDEEIRLDREKDSLNRRLEQLLQKQIDSAVSLPWLAREHSIDLLHAELARYRQSSDLAAKARLDLERRRMDIQKQARELDLPGDPAALDACRLSAPARLEIDEQAKVLARQREDLAALDETIRQCEQQQAVLRESLDLLPASAYPGAEDLTSRVDAFAKIAEMLPERRRQHDMACAGLERKLAQLPLVGDRGQEILRLALPLVSTLRDFQERLASADQLAASLRRHIEESQVESNRLRENRADLQRRSGLPDLSDLAEARLLRDQRFRVLQQSWEKGQASPKVQAEEYPNLVKAADDLADRLRVGAETLASLTELDQQIQRQQDTAKQHQAKLSDCEADRKILLLEWSELWNPHGIVPLSPVEMIDWRESWKLLTADSEALAISAADLERDEEIYGDLLAEMEAALAATGPFARLRQDLRLRIDEIHAANGERRSLSKQLNDAILAGKSLIHARANLEETTTKLTSAWAETLKRLHFPVGATPSAVTQLLSRQQGLFAELDRFHQISAEVADHEAFMADYEQRAGILAESLAVESPVTAEQVATFASTLALYRKEKIEQDSIAGEIQEIRRELDKQAIMAGELAQTASTLLKTAQLKKRESLPEFLATWQHSRCLSDKISELENLLLAPARGEALPSFSQRVLAEKHESLDADLAALARAHHDLTQERERAAERHRCQQETLTKYENASDLAAQIRQETALVTADIEQQARRFIRLEGAINFLESRIASYQEASQGPLMNRSGELFQEMTEGRFLRLETGWNDAGDPYLLARSAAGASLGLEALSEGTRDQLYLALRLAALEQHLESHESLPLILDDLFITFDDQRSAALLKVLARFAERTQILLFTHHRHLLDVADQALKQTGYHRHELSVG